MNAANAKESAKIRKLATAYNQIPNVFWSIIGFAPIGYYCFVAMDLKWLAIFSAMSLLPGFLPNSFFAVMQLSKTTDFYEKIGIRFVKKFTQDGDLINRVIRRRFPQYKVFNNTVSIQKHIGKAYYIERFHFVMFAFFLLTSIYALVKGHVLWAVIITITNLIFNLCPNLLQQYNRLRFKRLMKNAL